MATNEEKFDRWLNAYLDDTLSPEQRSRFEEVLENSPELRREVELQSSVDDALKRLYAAPTAKLANDPRLNGKSNIPFESTEPQVKKPASDSKQKTKNRTWIGWAAAAVIVISVGGGAWWWMNYTAIPTSGAPKQYASLAEYYNDSAKSDFEVAWECKSEIEFAATFAVRVGYGLKQPETPTNIEILGLKYGHTLSGLTVHIMAKVDGKGVVVFVDKKSRAPIKTGCGKSGLNAYTREFEHLVAVEVSPLDKAYILPLLEERFVTQDEKSQGYRR